MTVYFTQHALDRAFERYALTLSAADMWQILSACRDRLQRNEQMIETPRTTLTDGRQVYPEHRDIIKDGPRAGQQQDYVVLAEEERAKGFVRPVRHSYVHLKCGTKTTMGQTLAETYARDPNFYSGTFCCGCRTHFPVGAKGEFVWDGTNEKVGT